jgi:glucose-6-phosphate 1-dehydrogenase
MQNHLIQILALVGMEAPITLNAEDVRDEKVDIPSPANILYTHPNTTANQVKLLRAVSEITLDDLVIGQYTASADKSKPSYLVRRPIPVLLLSPAPLLTLPFPVVREGRSWSSPGLGHANVCCSRLAH